MNTKFAKWSLLAAAAVLVGQPALALPDTSVRQLADEAPLSAQVTSVSQLTDVKPTDWAFQALQSLVERYGCIAGYPSKVFLGNKSLTRYELAAGLNACLDKINELVAAGTADLMNKDDLATVKRLQDELGAESRALRNDISALEAKAAELASQQFSTTTKLDGEVIFQALGANAGSPVFQNNGNQALAATPRVGGSSQNTVFSGRARLNIRARNLATRGDQLRIRLTSLSGDGNFFQGGNIRVARFDTLGSSGGQPQNGLFTGGFGPSIAFDKVFYEFPAFDRQFNFGFGPRIENIDFLGTNTNTASETRNFSLRVFRRNIGISLLNTSASGGYARWNISPQFRLTGYYGAPNGGDSFGNGDGGLTGPSQLALELQYNDNSRFRAAVGYYRTVCNASGGSTPAQAPGVGNRIFCDSSTGGDTRAPFAGIATTGLSTISNVQHDTFNFNADWSITPEVSLFGRYSFGTATLSDGTSASFNSATLNYDEWMLGVTFDRPFNQQGNAFAFAVVQPAKVNSGSSVGTGIAATTFGGPAGNVVAANRETNYGFYYRIGVAPRIIVTPELYFVTNAGSIANPTITVGAVKAVFTF